MSMMIEMIRHRITHFLLAILLFASCREAPVTERKQLILIPEASEMRLGEDAFRKIIKGSKLSRNGVIVEKVKKVGKSVAKASNRPFSELKMHIVCHIEF